MNIAVIFAPYDSGHYKKRLALGAVALSEYLEKRLLSVGHSVSKKEIVIDTAFPREVTTSFDVIRAVSTAVSKAESQGAFPIVFSGNCNASAVGTLSGLKEKPGVIWFDCHGDFNTPETTTGGFLDGMAISIVTGDCWGALAASVPGFVPTAENCVVQVGSRDILSLKHISEPTRQQAR
ncbi:arginase family protein, partial [Fulvivirgaceae bacterium PWU4]